MLPEAAFCKLLGAGQFSLSMPWLPPSFDSLRSFTAQASVDGTGGTRLPAEAYSQIFVLSLTCLNKAVSRACV